jgi:hypothetical protein
MDIIKMLRTAERYLSPPDELYYMAVSMLADDLFPPLEIMVLKCFAKMVLQHVINNYPASKADRVRREWSLHVYADDLDGRQHPDFVRERESIEDDARPMETIHNRNRPDFERVKSPSTPWRSIAHQRVRLEGLVDGPAMDAPRTRHTGLIDFKNEHISKAIKASQYAVVFEDEAKDKQEFQVGELALPYDP